MTDSLRQVVEDLRRHADEDLDALAGGFADRLEKLADDLEGRTLPTFGGVAPDIHDTPPPPLFSDGYVMVENVVADRSESDESVDDVSAAFEVGEKGVTGPPPSDGS